MEEGINSGSSETIEVIKSSTSVKGEPMISTRQAELIQAIKGAIAEFKNENWKLLIQMSFWAILSIIIIVKGFCIVSGFINNVTDKNYLDVFKNFQNWQIYFYIVARVTLITGLFSIASFLLKMFRSTYHIFQFNRHRLNIIRALPSFIAASKDSAKEEEILAIILKTIIKYNKTGLISKEADMGNGVSLIEKLIHRSPH